MWAGRVVRSWVAGCIVVGIVAGCSGVSALRDHEVEPEDAHLGDAVVAFFLSPQSVTFSHGSTGYLVLVDADGHYRVLLTEPMDVGRPVWTDDGLFFADSGHDYLLSDDGLSVVESVKPDYQNALLEIDGSMVGVYNHGFVGESGYRDVLVAHTAGRSTTTPLEGDFGVVADCAGVLVGWTEIAGTIPEDAGMPELPDTSETVRSVLSRLWPGDQTVLGTHEDEGSAGTGVVTAPCLDGIVHVLGSRRVGAADSTGGYGMAPVLLSWDTETGERVSRDLVDHDGGRLDLSTDEISSAQYGSASAADGRLRWLAPSGGVFSTELATGVTTELFDTGISLWDGRSASTLFTEDDLYVLASPTDSRGPLELQRFALADGASDQVVSVDGITSALSVHLVLRGVAVAPEVREAR